VTTTVQAIGECMLEVARQPDGNAALGYAGDTYNTAVYLARVARQLAIPTEVRYLTGIGHDNESLRMLTTWEQEGVGSDAVVVPGATVGAYLITTNAQGERSFTYWRRNSAAAQYFERSTWTERVTGDYVYLSGISLQLMGEGVLDALVLRLRSLRRAGTVVVFDSNYRPTGWPDPGAARAAVSRVLSECDIALVTLEDEVAMGAATDVESCGARLVRAHVAEAVIKVGAEGAFLVDGAGQLMHVPCTPRVARDTTAAGDSFNGAYLAARIGGYPPSLAARAGNLIAGHVVTQPGAIVALDTMPSLRSITEEEQVAGSAS
jgi:2-dehydro-3-deoxygluconokinase